MIPLGGLSVEGYQNFFNTVPSLLEWMDEELGNLEGPIHLSLLKSEEEYQNDLECLRNMSGIIHKIARDLGIISCFGRTETVDEIVDCIEDLTTRINDHLEAIEQRISD